MRSARADAKSSDWVVLQISRVQVLPTRVDRSTWDGVDDKKANGCGLIGMVGKAVGGPVAGDVATFICERSGSKQAERDPRAPDLFVQMTAGTPIKFRTPIATDTYNEVFDYQIVVPLRGLGPAGLEFQVLDHDDEVVSGELIGMIRVSAKDIAPAKSKTPPLLKVADGQVERLEILVLPYEPPVSPLRIEFDVKQPLLQLKTRARAGEFVRIAATGSFSVANNGEKIEERGYQNGEKQGYNLKGFEQASHGAAVAFIGAADETHSSLVIGRCIATLAPVTGAISVGVNDNDRGNNAGSVRFDVEVGPPTLDEWRTGESARCAVGDGKR